jgi:hypothetical protein
MTVYRTLLASGLNHPLIKPRIKRKYRCWQRMHPNSLWQCDLKQVPEKWLMGILDDHSRYVTGSDLFTQGIAENPPSTSTISGWGSDIFSWESRSRRRKGKIEPRFRTYDLEHGRFPLHRKFIGY